MLWQMRKFIPAPLSPALCRLPGLLLVTRCLSSLLGAAFPPGLLPVSVRRSTSCLSIVVHFIPGRLSMWLAFASPSLHRLLLRSQSSRLPHALFGISVLRVPGLSCSWMDFWRSSPLPVQVNMCSLASRLLLWICNLWRAGSPEWREKLAELRPGVFVSHLNSFLVRVCTRHVFWTFRLPERKKGPYITPQTRNRTNVLRPRQTSPRPT